MTQVGDLRAFADLAGQALGFRDDAMPEPTLAETLARRAAAHGWPVERYLAWLPANLRGQEMGALASELTVSETYFFREPSQLAAYATVALPELARMGRTPIRVLSAGCSTGEEPYSLAILALESQYDVVISALDANPRVIDRARKARYTPWALRETSPAQRSRWFRQDGDEFVLAEAVRSSVTFEQRNLILGDLSCGTTTEYDIVFCRNTLMYLTRPNTRTVIDAITRALAPGGFLFLGHAEPLRDDSDGLRLRSAPGAFFYQRENDLEPWPLGGPATRSSAATPRLVPLPGPADASSPAATSRTTAVPSSVATPRLAAPPRQPAEPDLSAALALFDAEQFLAALDALPPGAGTNRRAALLRAVLLASQGDFRAAEDVCRELLARNRHDARAHYALATCRDAVGDQRGAAEHSRTAAALDPTFAMPRLHLGLLARRSGDPITARRELTQALALMPREQAERIRFHGGGFSRAALVKLCRTELLACGGSP